MLIPSYFFHLGIIGLSIVGVKKQYMENLNEALGLLAVGMIMVFFILILVVVIGNMVIALTNRFAPVSAKPGAGGAGRRSRNPKKLAVIAAVVDLLTHGQGRVDSVRKK